jgi:transcriptional regulator with XRE-family HTH domain
MLFGDKLRSLRIEASLSVSQLAYKAGLTSLRISDFEHSHYDPNPSELQQIADALRVKPEDLKEQSNVR